MNSQLISSLTERIAELNRQEEQVNAFIALLNPNRMVDNQVGYFYSGRLNQIQAERSFLAGLLQGVN